MTPDRRSWSRRLRALTVTGAAVVAVTACGDDGGSAERAAGPVAQGREIFESRDCNTCHSTSGDRMTGPALDGIYGEEVELVDGSTVTVDDAYLARSITDPSAQVVAGFNPVMPDLGLSDEDVDALVAYITSLSE